MTSSTADAPDPGLYGPDSVTWRVHADPSMALAGLRALLLQAVHPLAMSGVAQHSDFRQDPWGRLFRTAEYVAVTTYGTTAQAQRAGAKVRGIHRRLAGIEPESGTAYRVDDPELLRWVHCVEVESFLSTAVRCGARISRADQDRYYREQQDGAQLVGLDDVPGSVREMADYFEAVRPQLRVTAAGRDAARFVLWPPMPALVTLGTPARPAWVALATASFAMLPRWARRLYSLPGLPTTDLAATAAGLAFRSGLLVVPDSLRAGPHLKDARARLALEVPCAGRDSRPVLRRPAARADVGGILSLLLAYDVAFRAGPDTDEADVTDDWDSPGFDAATQTLVLEDEGRVVGFATVVEEYAEATVAPDRPELLAELVTWLESHDAGLEHYVPVADTARHALLEARGWLPARRFWRMRRELTAPVPAAVWPAGVSCRSYDRPADDETVHALVQTCFREIGGQHERTLPEWRTAMLETGRYDPSLYLLAVDAGRVVGAALAQSFGPPGEYGFVRQLAVAPTHRGRGLALALLHECFRRFADRGLPAVVLGVDAGNPTGALQLYERAGMRVAEEFVRWDRPA